MTGAEPETGRTLVSASIAIGAGAAFGPINGDACQDGFVSGKQRRSEHENDDADGD
jgi:hypothetical protein